MSVVNKSMAETSYALQLEQKMLQVGIRPLSFDSGTFMVQSALNPRALEEQLITICPSGDIQVESDGTGSKASVRIAGASVVHE